MNPAKSKYDPGPAPTSSTTTIESDENKYKVDAHTVKCRRNRNQTHISFDAKTDGKDYPLSGVSSADMISVKRDGAKTIETTWKKDGKTVMKTHAAVSSDGKTRTVTFDGSDLQGHKHNVVVFEKRCESGSRI